MTADSFFKSAPKTICRVPVTGLTHFYVWIVQISEIISMLYLAASVVYSVGWGIDHGSPPITTSLVYTWSAMSAVSVMTALLCMNKMRSCALGMVPFILYQLVLLGISCYTLAMWTTYPIMVKNNLDNTVMAQIPGYEDMILGADTVTLAYVFITICSLFIVFRLYVIHVLVDCFFFVRSWVAEQKRTQKYILKNTRKDALNNNAILQLDTKPSEHKIILVSIISGKESS